MKRIIAKWMLLCLMCGSTCAQASENDSENGLGYICEGTQWVSYLKDMVEFMVFEPRTYVNSLQGVEEINGIAYMVLWFDKLEDNLPPSITGYIRTDGEKVYFLKDASGNSHEFLLFDFSIQQGMTTSFVPSVEGQTFWPGADTTVKCLETGSVEGENETFSTMEMEFFLNGQSIQPDFPPVKWIRGIGSEYGITNNFEETCKFHEVYHDGILVYKAQNGGAGVESVGDDDVKRGLGVRRYHIDGREFKDGDTGVCIENGRKTVR